MGKYRHLPPEQAAELALQNMLAKIPQMTANYTTAMQEFASDPARQAAYKYKVSQWIAAMRDPEVRASISAAVARAKQKYLGKAVAVRSAIVEKVYG